MPGPRLYFGLHNAGGGVTPAITAAINAAVTAATLPAIPYAEEIFTMPFSFNDASPKSIFIIPAGARIVSVKICITTAFNDPHATLAIGDIGTTNRLMTRLQNIPSEIGDNESNVPFTYVLATQLILLSDPQGSSTGSGYVVIIYNLNN
jgi:hypothetical protein